MVFSFKVFGFELFEFAALPVVTEIDNTGGEFDLPFGFAMSETDDDDDEDLTWSRHGSILR